MKSLYLLVDLFTVIVPFAFSFHPRIQFQKQFKAFFAAAFVVAVFFLVWDEWFVRLNVWHFNRKYLLGVYVLSLPIEEVLFFFCIPFSCVFTFFCLSKFYPLTIKPSVENLLFAIITAICLAGAIYYHDRWYTASTCVSTLLTCFLLKLVFRVGWFGKAVAVYAVLLVPFIIVNGILTGAITAEPVVVYNNAENIGRRIFTIPVEDVFYGLTLYLLNIYFFGRFGAKAAPARVGGAI